MSRRQGTVQEYYVNTSLPHLPVHHQLPSHQRLEEGRCPAASRRRPDRAAPPALPVLAGPASSASALYITLYSLSRVDDTTAHNSRQRDQGAGCCTPLAIALPSCKSPCYRAAAPLCCTPLRRRRRSRFCESGYRAPPLGLSTPRKHPLTAQLRMLERVRGTAAAPHHWHRRRHPPPPTRPSAVAAAALCLQAHSGCPNAEQCGGRCRQGGPAL